MNAQEAKEITNRNFNGLYKRIEHYIEKAAHDGWWQTDFHVSKEVAQYTKDIIEKLKLAGFTVEHITWSHDSESNIIRISWKD